MAASRLKIIPSESDLASPKYSRSNRKKDAEEKYENIWKMDPNRYDPENNAREQLRIERTWDLILAHSQLSGKICTDLGSGYGVLTEKMQHAGASVDAVDIAIQALEKVQNKKNVRCLRQYVPYTLLDDSKYDLVVATDILAELPPDEYRIFFSELARLVKPNGYVIVSTPIDIYSEDALQRFLMLAETELTLEKTIFSYHSLQIKLLNFLKAPGRFYQEFRNRGSHKEIYNRRGVNLYWYKLNSSFPLAYLWGGIHWILRPIINLLEQNRWLLLKLEAIASFLKDERGISHVICLAKRRPFIEPLTPEEQPVERKGKKSVWE